MRWIVVGAVVAALGFALAGCGGSNESGNDAAADTVATDITASTEDTSTEETSTVDTSTEDASTTSTGDTSTEDTSTDTGNVAGLSGKCANLAKASQAFGAAIASSTGGSDDLDATADAYKGLAQNAPDEIKDDFEVLAGVMADYAKAFRDAGLKPGATPTPKQLAKLVALSQRLNKADVQKASAAISTWTQENCGSTP